jgi:DNA-binding GntR family transcriptional regulator
MSSTRRVPRHSLLHEHLRRRIVEGKIAEGETLPSEKDLAAKHGVARETVRQALGSLAQEGLISKRQGKGSIVVARRERLGLLSFRGFSEVTRSSEQDARTRIIEARRQIAWPDPFFYELAEWEQDAGCISLVRLRSIAEDAVMLENTYFPDLGEEFSPERLQRGSLFEALDREHGIRVNSVDQDLRACAAEASTAAMLGMETGSAVLHIYRRYGTSRPSFHVYSSLFCNTERYSIGTTFP